MSRMVNPRNNDKKNLSSFFFPLIIAGVVLILIIRAFFGSSNTTNDSNNNSGFLNVDKSQEGSSIFIYMSQDSKKEIDGSTKLFSTDSKLSVESGEAKVTFENSKSKVYLNKLAEIKYSGKVNNIETIEVQNGELWIEDEGENLSFDTRNLKLNLSNAGVFSISQNMMATSVYVLKGEALVLPKTDKKDEKDISVGVGQKITILNTDLRDSSTNFAEKIEPIDDFFKEGDFFIKHNGSTLLKTNESDTGSGSNSGTGVSQTNGKKAIIINYPEDEQSLDTNLINIEGSVVSSNVEKITLNNKEASINKDDKLFVLKDFELQNDINDITYKAYDGDNNIIYKGTITVYSSAKGKVEDKAQKPTVTTYPISSKDFRIITPTENPYKTTENVVKIGGSLNKGVVKFITINDFRLTKFSQFSTTWYYFANKDYGTMNDGINLYTIKYFGTNDELLYTSLVTIVKEAPIESNQEQTITPSSNESTAPTTTSGSTTEG